MPNPEFLDLEDYLKLLKLKNVDVSEVENYLERVISSSASKQLPEVR